jgi:hypothetical protein
VGTPRAKGPDPYARFDEDPEPPSNVRHFPTRDRELNDDLKLSGLLGPRERDTQDAFPADESQPGPGNETSEEPKSGETARSADEQD